MILVSLLAAGMLPAVAHAAATPTVCMQPLGKHEAALLAPIGRGIEQAYGLRVRTLPPRALPKTAWYPARSRYRADWLLDHLDAQVLPNSPACNYVLGFTAVDVSATKGTTFDWGVLGLSYTGAKLSVVSSFRMHGGADEERLLKRAVKVSLHELGHAIGLPHLNEGSGCLMNDAKGAIKSADDARGVLCPGERRHAQSLLRHPLPKRESLDWKAISGS